MKPYGQKKTHTRVAGHQECGDCHPEQKSMKTRGRREAQREIDAEKKEPTR